jgi:hypothetical protein
MVQVLQGSNMHHTKVGNMNLPGPWKREQLASPWGKVFTILSYWLARLLSSTV